MAAYTIFAPVSLRFIDNSSWRELRKPMKHRDQAEKGQFTGVYGRLRATCSVAGLES